MNNFVVFDFETDSADPYTCNPVEIAAMVIDPYNLELIESSIFHSNIKPEGLDTEGYLTDEKLQTIKWHCKNRGCSQDELLDIWRNAPPQKNVWTNFVQHINKYNPGKTQSNAPVACGMNIRNFDLIISNKLNEKYKITKLFNYEVVDLRDMFFYSLVWEQDIKSRSLDNMRKFFGMSNANSHTALQDVRDEASLIIRYLNFFKNTYHRTPNPYKGCMKTT